MALWSLPLLLIPLGGCGSGGLAPVSGTVTLDGKPLPNAIVSFQPVEGKDAVRGSVGTTDASGRYSLRVVTTKESGAVAGKHRVAIGTASMDDKDPPAHQPLPIDPVPERYNTKTELTFDVPPGGTSSADFALTSGAPGGPAK